MALTTVFLLCLPIFTFAGKIYKWVDEQGNTHYSQQRPSNRSTQMNIPSSSSRSAPAATSNSRKEATNKLLNAIAAERTAKAETKAKSKKEAKRLRTNCSNARKRVASLEMGGRRFDVTEQGERRYLDDTEIKKRLAAALKLRSKWCK
ncbi:MAG: DUF4124 domain-containing protein [Gammaproteobacteria bacterium]|nr:DUF4124 domain-containing protein [Gammaproteobacteria bacterium]